VLGQRFLGEIFRLRQGCQMVYLYTKKANLKTYLKVLGWKKLVCFMATWYILGILVYCIAIWKINPAILLIFSVLVFLHQEKSGNPGPRFDVFSFNKSNG
jgi:hypothetical protein